MYRNDGLRATLPGPCRLTRAAAKGVRFLVAAAVTVAVIRVPAHRQNPPAVFAAENVAEPARIEGREMLRGEMHLEFYDEGPTGDQPRKPAFTVKANAALTDEEFLVLEDAEAVFYGGNEETMRAYAPQCRVDTDRKTAAFDGGVRLEGSVMTAEIEDLIWDNSAREASTTNPVKMTSDTIDLDASAMRLIPREKAALLTDVRFRYQIGKGAKE